MTASMNMRSAATPSFVAAEEVMEGIFRALCGDQEPIACESFEIAPRAARLKMLRSAVARYNHKFRGKELERTLQAMKSLEKLAEGDEGIELPAAGRIAFAEKVQEQRAILASVRMAILLREQVARLSLPTETQSVIACARQIASGRIPKEEVLKHLSLVKRSGQK